VYLDTVNNKQFSLARMGRIGIFRDPATFLNLFTARNTSNSTGFDDPRYDELVEELAPAATSRSERYTLMAEAENLLMRQQVIIPIVTYTGKHLVQPSVRGYYPNVLEIRNFKYISLDSSAGVWQWEEKVE
jgi:oligopeptide transport system substrate-binding protein